VSLLFNRKVDTYRAFEFYKLYRDGLTKALNNCLYELAPVIGQMVRINFGTYDPLTVESLCTDILGGIFTVITADRLSFENEYCFIGYVKRCALNFALNYSREYETKEFDLFFRCTNPPVGRVNQHSDIDIKLLCSQRIDLIMDLFVKDIRFIGKEKKAAIFILECVLERRDNNVKEVCVRFGVSRNRLAYLINYTNIMLKDLTKYVVELDN
jgi:hypothetical protein